MLFAFVSFVLCFFAASMCAEQWRGPAMHLPICFPDQLHVFFYSPHITKYSNTYLTSGINISQKISELRVLVRIQYQFMQELFTAQCKTALICANGLIPPESEKPHNMVALLFAKFLHNLEKFLQYIMPQ